MIQEARLDGTGHGLVPAGHGWFVLNAREAQWRHREGRDSVSFTGATDYEAETYFPRLGVNLVVVEPGEATTFYHWEAHQEAYLVLSGEGLLIVEGQERPLRRWDFVHLPPGTGHTIVGAGSGPCAVLAMSSREHLTEPCGGGAYTVDETARRHGASADAETSDSSVAYARLPAAEPAPYRDGLLPGD